MRVWSAFGLSVCLLVCLWRIAPAAETPAPPVEAKAPATAAAATPPVSELAEFKTVETAVKATIAKRGTPANAGATGYLGINFTSNADGKVVVAQVAAESPAAAAGIKAGDLLVQIDEIDSGDVQSVRDLVQSKSPGDSLRLLLGREGGTVATTVTLGSTSRPRVLNPNPPSLGIRIGEPDGTEGLKIEQVSPGSPAEKSKLKAGEVILKIDGVPLEGPEHLRELLSERKPGDLVTLTLLLAEKAVEYKVPVAATGSSRGSRSNPNWDNRLNNYWKKDVYRLALVPIEFPDVKHNAKVSTADWDKALFSEHVYIEKSPTGQTVYGSLRDYYHEQSYGKLRVEGKVFDWVLVDKNRQEYSPDSGTSNKSVLLTEAFDKILARDGEEALKDFDGVAFVYAGDRPPRTNRGGLYWPHRANLTYKGKRWPYFICQEGSERMATISVYCHEFGHMLGLPDLYARPENPGSEGLGTWCAMSNQAGNGQPQHFSAWCKEQLGWISPTVIDPRVEQKLILDAIEDSPQECFKVLVKPDASEYLLLENRRRKGFDRSLPGEGLLIWRVVNNRPILEESHGIEGPPGPFSFTRSVPFPSASNDAFTPFTIPSSRSQLGGGLPVHITNIRRLDDGRIAFYIGFQFL
jgi:M6 family metalloprotease-like protein